MYQRTYIIMDNTNDKYVRHSKRSYAIVSILIVMILWIILLCRNTLLLNQQRVALEYLNYNVFRNVNNTSGISNNIINNHIIQHDYDSMEIHSDYSYSYDHDYEYIDSRTVHAYRYKLPNIAYNDPFKHILSNITDIANNAVNINQWTLQPNYHIDKYYSDEPYVVICSNNISQSYKDKYMYLPPHMHPIYIDHEQLSHNNDTNNTDYTVYPALCILSYIIDNYDSLPTNIFFVDDTEYYIDRHNVIDLMHRTKYSSNQYINLATITRYECVNTDQIINDDNNIQYIDMIKFMLSNAMHNVNYTMPTIDKFCCIPSDSYYISQSLIRSHDVEYYNRLLHYITDNKIMLDSVKYLWHIIYFNYVNTINYNKQSLQQYYYTSVDLEFERDETKQWSYKYSRHDYLKQVNSHPKYSHKELVLPQLHALIDIQDSINNIDSTGLNSSFIDNQYDTYAVIDMPYGHVGKHNNLTALVVIAGYKENTDWCVTILYYTLYTTTTTSTFDSTNTYTCIIVYCIVIIVAGYHVIWAIYHIYCMYKVMIMYTIKPMVNVQRLVVICRTLYNGIISYLI